MPPLRPENSDKNLVVKSGTYYTNEDVQFLHEVVAHAQELLPTLPERERVPTNALFNAYYALLPNVGIDADHDSRYARVLFKIGGTRSASSLFEKFETVLAQMGIVLEFDTDHDHRDGECTADKHTRQEIALSLEINAKPVAPEPLLGHQRRNSESSALDTGNDLGTRRTSRTQYRLSNSRPIAGFSSTSWRASFTSPSDTSEPDFQHFEQAVQQQEEDQVLRPELKQDHIRQISHLRTGSNSGSLRIWRSSPQPSEFDSRTTSTWQGSNDDDPAVSSLAQTAPTSKPEGSEMGHREFLVPNSQTLLDIKVSLLVQYCNKHLARKTVGKWRRGALRLRDDNSNLELLALHQDKQILLRQAFDSWQASLRVHQRATETERFFVHLEARADRARDIFILSKAFLHWVQSANDETKKTAAARRYILRTRYFEAWRGVTAINELKIQRQVLKKFLPVWLEKLLSNNTNDSNAMALYADNAVQRLFWIWCDMVWDRKALAWHDSKIKARRFLNWVALSHAARRNHAEASNRHEVAVTRTAHLLWTAKSSKFVQHGLEADGYRKGILSYKVLQQFGLQYSLCVPRRRLELVVSTRLKCTIVAVWLGQAKQEKLATDIDNLKTRREALVAWQKRVRCRTMQSQINSKFLHTALRAWILAEREIMFTRLLDRNLAECVWYQLVAKLQVSVRSKMRDLDKANEFAYRNLTNKALTTWRGRLQIQVQQTNAVSDLTTPRMLGDSLLRWVGRTRQMGQLQKWAQDGEFYFFANKTLKLWKNGVENRKRDKRRAAYVNVRRTKKLHLATSALGKWRHQFANTLGINRSSTVFRHQKGVLYGIILFDLWRDHTNDVTQLNFTSQQIQLKKHMDKLQNAISAKQDLEGEAIALFDERNLTLGVKKWARGALQLRASQHVVSEIRERSGKKNLRRIVVHWRQRIVGNMSSSYLSDVNQQRPTIGSDIKHLGATERAEAWSEFGDAGIDVWARELEDENPSSTIPGYLSTPSKKLSRARLIGKLYSTTPVAPLSTAFEKHLRAQYSSTPIRRVIGKSQLGKGTEAGNT